MEWKRPSQEILETFDGVTPPPPVVRKKMFGMPACFVNGNMFAFLCEERIVVRLAEPEREKLIKAGGERFGPMGRVMKEYVALPASYAEKRPALRTWMKKAQAHAESLPVKEVKPRKTAAAKTAKRGPAKNNLSRTRTIDR